MGQNSVAGILTHNLLDSPNAAIFQHDFDAMWVGGAFGQDASYNPFRQLSAALVLFLYDLYPAPRVNITTFGYVHVCVLENDRP